MESVQISIEMTSINFEIYNRYLSFVRDLLQVGGSVLQSHQLRNAGSQCSVTSGLILLIRQTLSITGFKNGLAASTRSEKNGIAVERISTNFGNQIAVVI